jgi:ABC-2 type transport system ATP-binding protein
MPAEVRIADLVRMKVIDQLVHFAALYGISRRAARAAAMTWLARFRIEDLATRRADTLSKGNQQKVQFIATVLQGPDVLLMDEPFVGLDPVNVALLKSAFLELRDAGKTLLFSTHQLDQAQALCDSVAIIDHGRLVTSGSTLEVRRSTGRRAVRIATSSTAAEGAGWLAGLPHVTVTRDSNDATELRVEAGADPQAILRAALDRGEEILTFEVGDPSLEEVFVERVGEPLVDEERTLATLAEPAR